MQFFHASPLLNLSVPFKAFELVRSFNVSERSLFCSSKLHLFDQKYCKNLKYFFKFQTAVFYVNICYDVIYFCDQSCIFSIITPVFSVTWSSEIIIIYWFAAQETFLIIINVENSCAAQYFCGNWDTFYFLRIYRWIESSIEQHLFEIENFCFIINVFNDTFDQFNVSLMNKSIHSFSHWP